MSMISSQVGELRFMAHMLDTDGHPSFAREVRRAADTIWELRNKLAGTVDQSERIVELEDENAKLRELLEAILQCAGETKRDKGCDACPMFNGDEAGAYLNKNWCLLRPTMRELGIEVPHD